MLLQWWVYLPALAWLTASGVLTAMRWATPTWVMVAAWFAAPVWVGWSSGWQALIMSCFVSVAVFAFFVFTGVVKRSTTVAVVPAVAALPPAGWLPLAVGLLLAGVFSLLLVRRAFGAEHVGGVAVGTMHAMGVGSSGPRLFGLGKPQLGSLPVSSRQQQPRLPLALFFAAPVLLTVVLAVSAQT